MEKVKSLASFSFHDNKIDDNDASKILAYLETGKSNLKLVQFEASQKFYGDNEERIKTLSKKKNITLVIQTEC